MNQTCYCWPEKVALVTLMPILSEKGIIRELVWHLIQIAKSVEKVQINS